MPRALRTQRNESSQGFKSTSKSKKNQKNAVRSVRLVRKKVSFKASKNDFVIQEDKENVRPRTNFQSYDAYEEINTYSKVRPKKKG